MEAVAIHNFEATKADELSFRKKDVLKVINTLDDPNWYWAQLGSRQGLVPWNYICLRDHKWYHGTISREDAELMLANQNVGAFLVRTSQYSHNHFSISLKCAHGSGGHTVQHFRVRQAEQSGRFFLWNVKFESLNEMIEYYRSVSISPSHQILLQDMSTMFQVQALYNFIPQEAGELEFRRGDIITVLNRDDDNWWEGQLDTRRGQFPVNYVKIPHWGTVPRDLYK